MTDQEPETGTPISELADFANPADEVLPGRVKRSINRHLLVADSLDLNLGAMLATAWHFIEIILEVCNPKKSNLEDPPDEG